MNFDGDSFRLRRISKGSAVNTRARGVPGICRGEEDRRSSILLFNSELYVSTKNRGFIEMKPR